MKSLHSHSLRVVLFASLALALGFTAAPGQNLPQPDPSHQKQDGEIADFMRSDMVLLPVTVSDKGNRPITQLPSDAFTIVDEQTPEKIAFFLADDRPASIGVLFDLSGSMLGQNKQVLDLAKGNILRFIKQSHAANEYFFVTFGGRVELAVDWSQDLNTIAERVSKITIPKDRQTALYDAMYLSFEKIRQHKTIRRVLLLITDGLDNNSRHRMSELSKMVKESDALVYAVMYVSRFTPEIEMMMANAQKDLWTLCGPSGGDVFLPRTPEELSDVFEQIALELRHQYLIGYYPTNLKRDGKWHGVKVSVKQIAVNDPAKPDKPVRLKELHVRARTGYYAKP